MSATRSGAPSTAYDAQFYSNHRDATDRSASAILPLVVSLLPRFDSMLDVGCGDGAWLTHAHRLGAATVHGVDGPWALGSLRVPRAEFSEADLSKPWRANRRFDLVSTLEVGEHLPVSAADTFVETLESHGDVVLFSAAAPSQGGTNHVNEQPPAYWAEKFAAHGFVPIDCIRAAIWNDDAVAWWYRQNTLIFARESVLDAYPALASRRDPSLMRPHWLIHPGWLLEREALARRLAARPLPRRVASAVRAALRGG